MTRRQGLGAAPALGDRTRPARVAAMLSPSMAEGVPDPPVQPMADGADPKLVTFLYLLMRDMLPIGYVEHTLARALRDPGVMSNPDLAAYADRVARTLTFDGSSRVRPVPEPGTIPASTDP